ncbi:outer membrane protein assembly factor BamB family protein [Parasphingorhabdus cellanae]|uniref:PQQ-binding-like beta-propeller repeat protein n=1 Tax=Parasphingorhabdus cellanae TaxID=2806553 RepID=A0ABX7T774_9SPHN|nr:PQQ-binding-like beta-propeller repeat protein [Parasphingorhabdus cellanae]QTD57454.1 PQQ-binding-like beta-propeller repeat protein [Parasphingorhabdus cellanae]
MRSIFTSSATILFAASFLGGCDSSGKPTQPDDRSANTVTVQNEAGKALYQQYCASCHDNGSTEAPTKAAIMMQGTEEIVRALNSGIMKEQASMLQPMQRRLIAEYLGSPKTGDALVNAKANQCSGTLKLASSPSWNRWGNGLRNSRYQPASLSGINPQTAPNLKLKWAFGFPGAARARSQPAVTREAIFTGSQSGLVYALDTKTGCVWWTFEAKAEVRNAPTISTDSEGKPKTLYFGDLEANVYAVDAGSGELLWTRSVRDHPAGTITGSITLYKSRLFVPMSSLEVVNAYSPEYECCTFRGGVLALDARTGETRWRFYTTAKPEKTGTNSVGRDRFGPSGAPIWSTPTVDRKRNLIYVGTGENYSSPANDMSDAIIALEPDSGAVVWVQQTIEGDAWNAACGRHGTQVNCPEENGPDFDFGAPPILTRLSNGKDIILAGQKSGMIYGMDPDNAGKILWEKRAGMGGFNGGVHWGMATDGETLFVGIADTPGNEFAVGPARQGMHAYDPATGKALWSKYEPDVCDENKHECRTALSAPPTITPGVIFSGALNGILRAYSMDGGTILWSTDTRREYETVNNVKARGGSIDSSGPVVANGLLIVNSGYDKFGQIPGNVMLVYGLE